MVYELLVKNPKWRRGNFAPPNDNKVRVTEFLIVICKDSSTSIRGLPISRFLLNWVSLSLAKGP